MLRAKDLIANTKSSLLAAAALKADVKPDPLVANTYIANFALAYTVYPATSILTVASKFIKSGKASFFESIPAVDTLTSSTEFRVLLLIAVHPNDLAS